MEFATLIPLITTIAPYVLQFIGSKSVQSQVTAAVQKNTGATDAAGAHQRIASDPDAAKALQADLAKIAADAAVAKEHEHTAQLAAALTAQTEQIKATLADTQSARATMVAVKGTPMEWGAPVISIIVTIGFFAVFAMQALHVTLDAQMVGALTVGFATVLGFWVGSSRSSQKKDDASADVLAGALNAALPTTPAPSVTTTTRVPEAPGEPVMTTTTVGAAAAKAAPVSPVAAPAALVAIHDSPQIAALKAANAKRWHEMHLKADRLAEFDKTAARLCASEAKARYQAISAATGVPWHVIAVIHEREAGGPPHWDKQLAQGDPLDKVSTHDPKGLGPFHNHPNDPPGQDAFYRGALVALIDAPPHAAKWTDWSAGGTLTLLEEYNGLGYANRGVPSAYVWSGTDQYVSGKYVADHVYRANVVDVQEGCAPIISRMMALDPTITMP